MPRRSPRNSTGIRGTGQANPGAVWRVFGCASPGCSELLQVEEDELERAGPRITVTCPVCLHPNTLASINKGGRWKYCRVCEQLQPLESFDRHRANASSFRSGRQLECKACKRLINATLNPLRTPDQHRESSERRRLYGMLAGERKLDQREVYRRFEHRCFQCGRELAEGEGRLDHTLPARFLWPLSLGPTLLCPECNGNKAEKWPSEFYRRDGVVDRDKLQRLSYLSGIGYELLEGSPRLNPEALNRLLMDVDGFLTRWIRYPEDVRRLRRTIRELSGIDVYRYASRVPDFLYEGDEGNLLTEAPGTGGLQLSLYR